MGGVTPVENMSPRLQEEDHKGFQKHLSRESDWAEACQHVGQVQLHRERSRAAPELPPPLLDVPPVGSRGQS